MTNEKLMCPTRINRPCEKNELDPHICQYCFKPFHDAAHKTGEKP